MVVLQESRLELPYDWAFLCLYMQKLKGGSERDIFIFKFIVASFMIVSWLKQPNCPWTEE